MVIVRFGTTFISFSAQLTIPLYLYPNNAISIIIWSGRTLGVASGRPAGLGKSCWGRLGDSVGYVAEAGVGADVGCGVNDNIPIIAIFVNTFFLFV